MELNRCDFLSRDPDSINVQAGFRTIYYFKFNWCNCTNCNNLVWLITSINQCHLIERLELYKCSLGLFLNRTISGVDVQNLNCCWVTFTHLNDAWNCCLSKCLLSIERNARPETQPCEKVQAARFLLLALLWDNTARKPSPKGCCCNQSLSFLQLTWCTDATAQQSRRAQPYQQAKDVPLLRNRADN